MKALENRCLTWKTSFCSDYSDKFTKVFFNLDLFFDVNKFPNFKILTQEYSNDIAY